MTTLLIGSSASALADDFTVKSFRTSQKAELNFSLTISFADRSRNRLVTTVTDSAIEKVDRVEVVHEKAAVLGHTGNVQVVEIIDIASSKRSDWFYCYEPFFFWMGI